MAGWEGKTLDQARADAHANLREMAATTRRSRSEVEHFGRAYSATRQLYDQAVMENYRLGDMLRAQRQNAEYLDGLPDDGMPGDPPSGVSPERQAAILAGIDRDVRP